MPNTSAYKNYDYASEVGFEKKYKLKDIVQECHAYNSKQNNWKVFPLKESSYGFDNLVICICYILKKIKSQDRLKIIDIEKLSDYIHRAWIKNYIYWRDNEPWKSDGYVKSAKPLK